MKASSTSARAGSGGKVIEKTAFFPHPPEAVWVALTDRWALAEWLMPNDFEPVMGRKFQFRVDPMPGFSGVTECEVLELDPPRRMVWSWVVVPKDASKPKPPPMILTWALTPEGNGTRLRLHQTGVEVLNWWWRLSMSNGWNRMLRTLLPKVAANVRDGAFTRGAITKRDHPIRTVPEHFAK
ncbi:MAG TPA: SRPBCC domain-containing protein [Gemmatimonadaceae bacterium]|nr:SRPBCC domain-containing protein [Gemmatimonadaceae bacterium]